MSEHKNVTHEKEKENGHKDSRPGKEGQPELKQLRLEKGVNEHDTVLMVGSTAGVGPHAGTVEVDGEKIHYRMASPDSLHGCIRGEEGEGGAKHDVGAIVKFLPPEETPEEEQRRLLDEKAHRTQLNVNKISAEEDARIKDEAARRGDGPLIAKRVREGQNPS
jgi:hypothetical protein